MEILCAVDIGTKNVGLAFFTFDGKLLNNYLIKCNLKDVNKRIFYIYKKFKYYIDDVKPARVIFEDVIYIQNAITTINLTFVLSVLKVVCWENNIIYSVVSNKKWKKNIIGNGNCNKTDILEFVKNKYNNIELKKQDEADAICIGLYGVSIIKNDDNWFNYPEMEYRF